jgi:hypothetical protein
MRYEIDETFAGWNALPTQEVVPLGSIARERAQHAEVIMFARKVTTRLKPNALGEFSTLMEYEVLPWLRQQTGFQDLIILAPPDGCEITTISFWDGEGNAHVCNSTGYPEVLRTLAQLLDATPYVKTFEVVSSTFRAATVCSRPRQGVSSPNPTSSADRKISDLFPETKGSLTALSI